ncbi:DUF4306 domain-containing protein [Rossellomorea aquimaris]|uniref:DUF4306 domain-containing protein n=1 Tax=Rossellomorea aquimaris TaxID=189382 RepID=UPI003D7E248F
MERVASFVAATKGGSQIKKRWILFIISLPIFLVSYVYSFFISSKIAYLPQTECKPEFIFTPQDVQYCSDIYAIDVFLIALQTNPISYLCLISGIYIVSFFVYIIFTNIKNRI